MTGKRVTPGEFATTLRTLMIFLARVQLAMALKIVKPSKPKLALLTQIWLLLAMGEEMALQVMVSSELCIAIRTLVFF